MIKKVFILLLIMIFQIQFLSAGDRDDAIENYEKLFKKMEFDLEFGNAYQKIQAIDFMSTFRRFRFVRPLSRELLKGLEDPYLRKMASNDPYIKSSIAIALGMIGRKEALEPLAKALQITEKIIQEERQKYLDNVQKAQQNKSHELFYERTEIAPALLSDDYIYPTSADVGWSIADDLKKFTAIDPHDEWIQIRLKGYNYTNLAFYLIQALGNLKLPEAADPILPYLNHPYKDLRLSAALALAKIGTPKVIEALEKKYQEENDEQVKVRIAFAILINDKTKVLYYRDLLKYLRSENVRIRYDVASAFRELAYGEAYYDLSDAILVEDNPIVKKVLQQAIDNAHLDKLFPPNHLLETKPSRLWIHGDPYAQKDKR